MRFLHDYNLKDSRLKRAHLTLCLLGLLAVTLLAGCGGGGGGNGNPGGTTGTNTSGVGPVQPALSVTATTKTGLTATLSEASSTVGVGGSLVYTLTLTNNTTAAIPVHATSTPTKPAASVKVLGPTGAASFDPLPGEPPFVNGSLAAGQSISTTQTATGFATAGVYSATATFGDDTTAPTSVGPLTVTAQ